jgi:hypothetical protein
MKTRAWATSTRRGVWAVPVTPAATLEAAVWLERVAVEAAAAAPAAPAATTAEEAGGRGVEEVEEDKAFAAAAVAAAAEAEAAGPTSPGQGRLQQREDAGPRRGRTGAGGCTRKRLPERLEQVVQCIEATTPAML